MNSVTIQDIGPIKSLAIPVPQDGGVIVLTGRNGAGKSEALAATEKLIRGSGALTKRDRCLTAGTVSGFGATIKVGAKTTRTGELEVTSLEDRLHISDLVDPKLKDESSADAKRIKALISLTGVQCDRDFFRAVTEPEIYDSTIDEELIAASDPIETAAQIKRAFEFRARQAEEKTAEAEASAKAAAVAVEGIDLTGESDPAKLQATHTQAVTRHTQLVAQKSSAEQATERRRTAETKLAETVQSYTGQTVAECESAIQACIVAGKQAGERLAEAEAAVARAKAEVEAARNCYKLAVEAKKAAEEHASTIAAFKDAINQTTDVTAPTDAELAQAAQAVADASAAMERGSIIRRAKADADNLADFQEQASKHRTRAESLRKAAAGVDAALSRAVACDELRIENGRIVTDTPERGPTHFSELSIGQRWKIALRIAIRAVGEHGVLVIPQEAWEGLDPENRAVIAQEVAGRKVTIITAEPSTGDLRAEQYTPEMEGAAV